MKFGKLKIISILVCLMLTVATMTVGVFAATSRFKDFTANGLVSFITNNIEGEVVGNVSGYGYISGNSSYNGAFTANNQNTTSNDDGNEIGNALKSWEMGDIHFTKNENKIVDIQITITIKNRGDRGININYIPPSTPENITLTYKQAVTTSMSVGDSDWQDLNQASHVGKVISVDEFGNYENPTESILLNKNEFYTFKMIISITNKGLNLDKDGVNLSFSFEMTAG